MPFLSIVANCTCGQACLPIKHIFLTSPYGYRIHPVTRQFSFHAGIDLRAHLDTVYAVLAGRVQRSGNDPLLGIYIRLENNSLQIGYGHLSQVFVMPGDSVSTGEPIGVSGATGSVTGEHLHFSVRLNGQYIDPILFLYKILKN